jgi:hypothetical protein
VNHNVTKVTKFFQETKVQEKMATMNKIATVTILIVTTSQSTSLKTVKVTKAVEVALPLIQTMETMEMTMSHRVRYAAILA